MFNFRIILAICCLSFSLTAYALMQGSDQPTAQTGTVALTFDDGPTVKYTPQILAILKKYQVKATFFMVGMNAKAHPEIVKMVAAGGHAIANHSNTHPNLTQLNEDHLQDEVTAPISIIQNISGKTPVCLRYPFNAANDHVRSVIRQHNMLPIDTSWNSNDYKRPGVDKIVSYVLNHVHSGLVIVMHDGFANREQTVAALPLIIEGIKKQGLGFSQICLN